MIKRICLTILGFICFINCFVISIYSEEKIIKVTLNNIEINEDTELLSYDQDVKIDVNTENQEIFATLEVVIMQNNQEIDILKEIDKDLRTISCSLPQGNNYTFYIKAQKDGKDITWYYNHKFHVVEETPVLLNDEKLKETQIIKHSGVLKIVDIKNVQIDKSYIMVNGEKFLWQQTSDGYEFMITDIGIYSLEFHFLTSGNIEIVRNNRIVIEDETINSKFIVNEMTLENERNIYKENINLTIQCDAVEPKNLKLTMNDVIQEIVWIKKDDIYETTILIEKEQNNGIKLYYDDGEMTLLNKAEIIIDKTSPIVNMSSNVNTISQDNIIVEIKAIDNMFSINSYVEVIYEDKVIRNQTWVKKDDAYNMQINMEKEGIYKLKFHCFDEAFNQAKIYENKKIIESERTFVIDKTAPIITSNMDGIKEIISNQKQEIRYYIKDDNLLNDSIELIVKRDNQPYIVEPNKKSNQGHAYVELTLEEDGFYEIQLIAKDQVNNNSTYPIQKFRIDQIKPNISLINLNKEISNQDVNFTISGSDTFIKEYKLSILRNNKLIKETLFTEDFQEQLRFHEDFGTHFYEVSLSGIDQAGNENFIKKTFVIDKDAPLIQAYFQQQPYINKVLTNKDLDVLLSWDDENLDNAKLLQYKNGELVQETMVSDKVFRKKAAALASHKDVYQYYLQVFDKAGNMSETLMDITLDADLPIIEIQDIILNKAINVSWTPTLKEINKEIYVRDVTLLKNKKVVPYSWKKPIEDEGNYQLYITVQDSAGNINSLKPINFEIDKTAPVIQVLNKKTKQEIMDTYEGEALEISIDTGFFHKDKIVSIKLDGQEYVNNETLNYELNLNMGDHRLAITAIDEAGNQTIKEMKFHILKPQTKPYISITLVGMITAFVLFLYRKKFRCLS